MVSLIDRFAEHDVDGADRQARPDEAADQVPQRMVGLILPSELQHLVDAPHPGLRPFVA
ncbi:hypothetical protein [Bradyrhizobium sp. ARR65]|uniref:hypothetical protein n=1 Tax=Bradyrhizobium sp. ARR65 TaxID=1040989 RepID=UPI0012FB19EE|nr:hypothetical protein [Bradyrhizobium sp. ARR65]